MEDGEEENKRSTQLIAPGVFSLDFSRMNSDFFLFSVFSVLNPFVRFLFRAWGLLFFRTGSSGETIPFVPDGPGIPTL
jgi:hypothetical protein